LTTTINASASAGLVQTADTSTILQLQTASTAALTIDASQNVGIGTTTPTAVFSNYKSFYLNGSSGSAIQMQYGGSLASNIVADSNALYLQNITSIQFGTGGTGTGTERMRIDSSGNLGVGTSSPNTRIQSTVGSNGSGAVVGLRLQNVGTTAGDGAKILFTAGTSTNGAGISSTGVALDSADLRFDTGGSNERMRITSTGAVGIGVTPFSFANNTAGLQVGTATIVQSIVSSQSLYAFNACYNGVWQTAAASTGYACMRLNATGAGNTTFHGSTSAYGANASLPNMDGSDVKMTIAGNGNIGAPNGTNIYNASDARLKKNIQPLTKGLDAIVALKPVSFNWITDFCEDENDKTLYGFVAQDTKEVDEHLVEGFSRGGSIVVGDLTVDNPMRVNEKFIIPMLAKAIQELKAINDTQAETINALTARIVALESK
jgi:hypothetical protein